MTDLSMLHVYEAQQILREASIPSIITGDVGLNYHGVDLVTHNLELCVVEADRDYAIAIVGGEDTEYEALPDLIDPDFYHPYKQGAARFQICSMSSYFELHLVVDSALCLDLSLPSTTVSGLTRAHAHPELLDLCDGIDDAHLSAIDWPSLASFLGGWLALAAKVHGSETELIFLMQAERLIDANAVDTAWFKKQFKDRALYEAAQKLLAGKERRRLGSIWD